MSLRVLLAAALVLAIGLVGFSVFRHDDTSVRTDEPRQVIQDPGVTTETADRGSPGSLHERKNVGGEVTPLPDDHSRRREQSTSVNDIAALPTSIEQLRRANSMGWPTNIESMILDHISRQGLEFVSIDSVTCDDLDCVVEFTGAPGRDLQYYERLEDDIYLLPWNVGSVSFGGVEAAPGIKRFGLRLSNVRMTPELIQRLRDNATEAADAASN